MARRELKTARVLVIDDQRQVRAAVCDVLRGSKKERVVENRHDELSVYGIARELSALTGAPLQTPSFPAVPEPPRLAELPVQLPEESQTVRLPQ